MTVTTVKTKNELLCRVMGVKYKMGAKKSARESCNRVWRARANINWSRDIAS